MKAVAVFPKTKEVRLINHPEPRITSQTQVKIKMLHVGVCGTDREIWSFEYGDPPVGSDYLITGHESFGQVVEVGPDVNTVNVGDYVVPTVRRGCLENCLPCANGTPDFCFTGHFTERGIKQAHGYMAEYVVDEEKYMNVIPSDIADVAVLLEPLTITEKALIQMEIIQSRIYGEERGNKSDVNALVLGAGPVGFLAAMALQALNMKTYVVARAKRAGNTKAEMLASFGAEYFSTEELTPQQIAQQIGNIDLILEATGAAKASFDFLQVLGTNGLFVFTGVPGLKKDITLDAGTLMRNMVLNNQVVLGTVNAPRKAFQKGIEHLKAFKQKWPKQLNALITGRFRVDDLPQILSGRQKEEIKSVILFDG